MGLKVHSLRSSMTTFSLRSTSLRFFVSNLNINSYVPVLIPPHHISPHLVLLNPLLRRLERTLLFGLPLCLPLHLAKLLLRLLVFPQQILHYLPRVLQMVSPRLSQQHFASQILLASTVLDLQDQLVRLKVRRLKFSLRLTIIVYLRFQSLRTLSIRNTAAIETESSTI